MGIERYDPVVDEAQLHLVGGRGERGVHLLGVAIVEVEADVARYLVKQRRRTRRHRLLGRWHVQGHDEPFAGRDDLGLGGRAGGKRRFGGVLTHRYLGLELAGVRWSAAAILPCRDFGSLRRSPIN